MDNDETTEPDHALPPIASVGTKTAEIEVKISYRIIQLFSEGLYASPNKAIEELVSNSFDAGAENVHVVISPDLVDDLSTIVVIDDGLGMDIEGLANHWIIGESNKRKPNHKPAKGRKQIGKFGIGKLATYVLASRLTHVTKVDGCFYAVSMDYSGIPDGGGGGTLDDVVPLDVRELTESQAKELLAPWTTGDTEGFSALRLFGEDACDSWTVAVMSDLKDMALQIKLGRLKWVLSTAMPLRSDFCLFLNGESVSSSKLKGKRVYKGNVGKGVLANIPKPASDEFEVTVDSGEAKTSVQRTGLTHPQLGRITGTVEVFEDLLTQGKAASLGRSHGFFVYVHGRLVNADDEYFGISSNKLKHGTFSRFRCEVNIDRLDAELRSSRETVRQTSLIEVAHNFLIGVFNIGRKKHEAFVEEDAAGRRATQRVADSPVALARTPLRNVVARAIAGDASPSFVKCGETIAPEEQESYIQLLDKDLESEKGLIREIIQTPLGQHAGIAIFDADNRVLEINSLHPFVAYFGDEFSSKSHSLPLELLATSEVLLEASMYEMGIRESQIRDVMEKRDALLRELARSTGKRNALMISQDVQNASSNQDLLEEELVAAFDSLGFDAVPIGGKGKRDGLAEGLVKGKTFKVSLEARAKLKPDKRATAASISVKTIVRQRDNKEVACDHALVLLADFPSAVAEKAKIERQLDEDQTETGRSITFVRVIDFARLVRLAPAKRLGLPKLKEFLNSCRFPNQCKAWIDAVAESEPSDVPYREILEAIADEQKQMKTHALEYSSLEATLRHTQNILLKKKDLIAICQALHRIVPEYVYATDTTVGIMNRPDRIMNAFNATIKSYPDSPKKPRGKKTNR